jgi:hypothetical protein
MPHDIAPLGQALERVTHGEQADVYGLLVAWDQSIANTLDRDDRGSRFREVMSQYHERVIDLVDAAATNAGINWPFLQDCVEAYPPGIGDHHCSSVLSNVVARCVIRTRIRDGVAAVPAWALDYLADITPDDDGDWSLESSGAFGWGVGHPEVAVLDRTVERAERDDWWAMDVLQHVAFTDPDAGITLLARLLRSPDVGEDLLFVDMLEPLFEQDFPDFPQYWEPEAELDYEVTLTDDRIERLLSVLGETIHPDRLRQFDDSYAFDFSRAAEVGVDSGMDDTGS